MIDETACGVYQCRFCGGETLWRPVVPGKPWAEESTEIECCGCNNKLGYVEKIVIVPGRAPQTVRSYKLERMVDGKKIEVAVLDRQARRAAWLKLCHLQGRADEALASTLPPDVVREQAMRDVERYSSRRSP